MFEGQYAGGGAAQALEQNLDESGGVRVIYFTRTAQGELILLTLYAKAKTDNLTGPILKEIRRALEN